jgi:hypothetical protein
MTKYRIKEQVIETIELKKSVIIGDHPDTQRGIPGDHLLVNSPKGNQMIIPKQFIEEFCELDIEVPNKQKIGTENLCVQEAVCRDEPLISEALDMPGHGFMKKKKW